MLIKFHMNIAHVKQPVDDLVQAEINPHLHTFKLFVISTLSCLGLKRYAVFSRLPFKNLTFLFHFTYACYKLTALKIFCVIPS